MAKLTDTSYVFTILLFMFQRCHNTQEILLHLQVAKNTLSQIYQLNHCKHSHLENVIKILENNCKNSLKFHISYEFLFKLDKVIHEAIRHCLTQDYPVSSKFRLPIKRPANHIAKRSLPNSNKKQYLKPFLYEILNWLSVKKIIFLYPDEENPNWHSTKRFLAQQGYFVGNFNINKISSPLRNFNQKFFKCQCAFIVVLKKSSASQHLSFLNQV